MNTTHASTFTAGELKNGNESRAKYNEPPHDGPQHLPQGIRPTPTIHAIHDALHSISKHEYVVGLKPTSPIRSAQDRDGLHLSTTTSR